LTSKAFSQNSSKTTRSSNSQHRIGPRTSTCISENTKTSLTTKYRWPTTRIRCTKIKEIVTYLEETVIAMMNNFQKRMDLKKIDK
jgi:hypothetical protein